MKFAFLLSVTSALFALAAALLWFASAVVKTPSTFSIKVTGPIGTGIREGQSEDSIVLAQDLRRQSKFSAWAAVCAGISALAQAAALIP